MKKRTALTISVLAITVLFVAACAASAEPTMSAPKSSAVSVPTPTVSATAAETLPNGLDLDELVKVSPDTDGDGTVNILDNCPLVPNPAQADSNDDGIGDVCHVVELAKADLVHRLGLNGGASVYGIGPSTDGVEDALWPDSCLGLPSDDVCTGGEIPGYRLTLNGGRAAPGKKYVYHTDKLETFRFVGVVGDP